MAKKMLFTALLFLLATPASPGSSEIMGTVQHIEDGDTLLVVTGTHEHWVRFYGIDAPESDQPYGAEATDALRDVVSEGDRIRVEITGRDRYERMIGQIYADGVHVNAWMIEHGHAWAYDRYLPRNSEFHRLEAEARSFSRGLWAADTEELVPPWQWRHQ